MERRSFIAGASAAAILAPNFAANVELPADPFTLGVASGDPTDSGFVLWTRLAPDPLHGGGMPDEVVMVDFEIAVDRNMNAIVRTGQVAAVPEYAHSVHLVVSGLESNQHYWYRFSTGGFSTEPARARTLPGQTDALRTLRLGHLSCQNYVAGQYVAFDDMVGFDLDYVVHLGDYIYETHARNQERSSPIGYDEPITLEQYRNTYGLYKSDPRLQRAHAHCPWLMTWDDHELENGYHGDSPSPADASTSTPEEFIQRKADAYQAWWEHTPVAFPPPVDSNLAVHRSFALGGLAQIHLLDTRQYRTPNPCDFPTFFGPRCDNSFAPETTMLGFDQEAWLDQQLQASTQPWQIIGSPNLIQQWRFQPTNCAWAADNPEAAAVVGIDETNCDVVRLDRFLHEAWDGYPNARARMLESGASALGTAIYLSGGIHSGWVSTMKADFENDDSEVVGVEFVGPSTTSNPQLDQFSPNIIENNEHVKWSSERGVGWTLHVLSASRLITMFRTTTFPATEQSKLETSSGWLTRAGNPVPKQFR